MLRCRGITFSPIYISINLVLNLNFFQFSYHWPYYFLEGMVTYLYTNGGYKVIGLYIYYGKVISGLFKYLASS